MTQSSNICGASHIKNHILFIYGHDIQLDDLALRQIIFRNIQLCILKVDNSINSQTNDNIQNAKIKSLYNVAKSALMLKYGTKKFQPHHMNSALVEPWDAFKVSGENIIRDRFL